MREVLFYFHCFPRAAPLCMGFSAQMQQVVIAGRPSARRAQTLINCAYFNREIKTSDKLNPLVMMTMHAPHKSLAGFRTRLHRDKAAFRKTDIIQYYIRHVCGGFITRTLRGKLFKNDCVAAPSESEREVKVAFSASCNDTHCFSAFNLFKNSYTRLGILAGGTDTECATIFNLSLAQLHFNRLNC